MKIPKQIEAISSKWVTYAPFFAEFLLNFSYRETKAIPTCGISCDKKFITLYYNIDFFDKLSQAELSGVLIHEILHVLKASSLRKGNRDHNLFNIAHDIVINEEIHNKYIINGIQLQIPKTDCKFSNIIKDGYKGDLIAEEIYEFLLKQNKKYETIDDHSLLDKLQEKINQNPELQNKIKEIIENAKMRGYGNISNNLKATIEELTKEKLPSIEGLLLKAIQFNTPGKIHKKNSWAKCNRRSLPLQGKKQETGKMNIAIDVSGSCYSQDIISRFFYVIDKISKKFEINLIEFDTEIKNSFNYKKGNWKNIKLSGGGGTIVQPIFDLLKNNKNPLVILTDGEFDYNLKYYNLNPLWIIIQDNKFKIKKGFLK